MPSNPQRNPFSILCEKCGYHLAGLTGDDRCPECGRPARLSHPSRRQGTPWQRRIGPISLVRTWAAVLWSPIDVWSRVRFDRPWRDAFLAALTIACAALAPVPPWIAFLIFDARPREFDESILAMCVSTVLVAGALTGLLAISLGVRRLHALLTGSRATLPIMRTIVAHAAAPFLFAPILSTLATTLNVLDLPLAGWEDIAVGLLSALTFIVPLLSAMTLVAIGNARLRFANRTIPPVERRRRRAPRPGPIDPPQPPAQAGQEA